MIMEMLILDLESNNPLIVLFFILITCLIVLVLQGYM